MTLTKTFRISTVMLAMGLFFAPTAHATEFILNGGFETGDFTSWTTTPSGCASDFSVNGVDPQSGIFSADFTSNNGCGSQYLNFANYDRISQTFATIPSDSYTVSFWIKETDERLNNGFRFTWNGFDLPGSPIWASPAIPWTHYVIPVVAAGPFSMLEFAGYNTPADWRLDDVSVQDVVHVPAEIPEPASMLLVGTGLMGLVRARRHRSRPPISA